MKYPYFLSEDYTPRVKVEINSNASDIFTIADEGFLKGERKNRPPDFDLHLGIFILARETVPDNLLEPIKQWALENKMVIG